MPGRTSRRAMTMWTVLVLVLIGAFVPPYVNVNRFRKRVADSIGRALGREVTVSNIELQLLPRPGLVLSNFEVAEEPSYGAEPMLRAGTVTALLRFSSLWRGRLEIGTLEIEDPSLNLVRRADGHWNLEELVERASQVPSAPTGKSHPEARPRFPYIKASSGRINFKLGLVKKAFAFTDADFGLWLESENEWGVRLEGRPMRTDVGISDTGTVRMEGTFRRASSLRDTPVSLRITFNQGQLGQITKLVFGRDRGWRGGVTSNAIFAGTPSALGVTFDGQVDDFRRYDIALGEALRLRVHCTGTYSSVDDAVRDLLCVSPAGPGSIRVSGSAQGWIGKSYDLGVSGEQIPMERIVAFARHAKKDLPADLTATGNAEGTFSVHKTADAPAVWSGGGTTTPVVLESSVLKQDLEVGALQFAIPSPTPAAKTRHAARARMQPGTTVGLRLDVKPFPVPLGAASPAISSAAFDREHYAISLAGGAELTRLVSVAQALGVATPGIGLAGDADVNLTISGTWAGFAPPAPSGQIQVRNASAELQGIAEPLQISSATASISDQVLNISALNATFADGPALTGSASLPVRCTAPETCVVHFDLHTNEVALDRINQLVNPSFAKRPWYRLLAVGQQHEDALLKLRASGHITAAHVAFGTLPVNNLTADLTLDGGRVHLSVLNSELLGGRHSGAWDGDFTQSPPRFTGGGAASRISAEQLSTLMHDSWATGTLGVKYALSMRGASPTALRDSADGSATFVWTGGSLRHMTLDGHGAPLAFSNFSGTVSLRKGTFSLADCKLQAGSAAYVVKGTASYNRDLDVRLERTDGPSYAISGPLDQPRVQPLPASSTEAQLR